MLTFPARKLISLVEVGVGLGCCVVCIFKGTPYCKREKYSCASNFTMFAI